MAELIERFRGASGGFVTIDEVIGLARECIDVLEQSLEDKSDTVSSLMVARNKWRKEAEEAKEQLEKIKETVK